VDEALGRLRSKVERAIKQLHKEHPGANAEVEQLSRELKGLGVKPDTAYLYMQGHHLSDRIVLPLLKRVCASLVHQRQKEIASQSVNYSQQQGELACYARSISDVETMLRKNRGYMESEEYSRIVADVAAFFGDDSPAAAE